MMVRKLTHSRDIGLLQDYSIDQQWIILNNCTEPMVGAIFLIGMHSLPMADTFTNAFVYQTCMLLTNIGKKWDLGCFIVLISP